MMIESNAVNIIFALGGLGLLFGGYNIYKVFSVTPKPINTNKKTEEDNDGESLFHRDNIVLTKEQCDRLNKISGLISSGANVFLLWEYLCLLIFVIVFSAIIYSTAEHHKGTFYTTFAFVVGALTSIFCGFIGMMIATASNYRTAYRAQYISFLF
jgi:hypothetical protein